MFTKEHAKNRVDIVVISAVEVDSLDTRKEYDSPIDAQIRLYLKYAEIWLLEDVVKMLEQLNEKVEQSSKNNYGDKFFKPNLGGITQFYED